jgi:anti-sigma factor RsiW
MHDHSRKSISDETLMRFVDGDLPPDERAVIAGEVARNPDLAQRLEAFRFTKEELAGAFAPALEAPPELIEKIMRGGAPASRISRLNLPALPYRPQAAKLTSTCGHSRRGRLLLAGVG